jgi:hypothetical protein
MTNHPSLLPIQDAERHRIDVRRSIFALPLACWHSRLADIRVDSPPTPMRKETARRIAWCTNYMRSAHLTNPLAIFLRSIRRHTYDKHEARTRSGNGAHHLKRSSEVAELTATLDVIIVSE